MEKLRMTFLYYDSNLLLCVVMDFFPTKNSLKLIIVSGIFILKRSMNKKIDVANFWSPNYPFVTYNQLTLSLTISKLVQPK